MPGRRGRVVQCQTRRAAVSGPGREASMPGAAPSRTLTVPRPYLTRQATEHPRSPGSLLYVLYVLYLTRQATEHPLSPGSLLYVLYVLYGPI